MVRARTMNDDISTSISVLQRRPWTGYRSCFLHNYRDFFLFLRTTSEESDILSYCLHTTVNKLSHNSGNISERRGIMESCRILQRCFHKIHNVTVAIVCHTWVACICLRGWWIGETEIRCMLMTVIASRASSTSSPQLHSYIHTYNILPPFVGQKHD